MRAAWRRPTRWRSTGRTTPCVRPLPALAPVRLVRCALQDDERHLSRSVHEIDLRLGRRLGVGHDKETVAFADPFVGCTFIQYEMRRSPMPTLRTVAAPWQGREAYA
jgi:hypothetical protein